MEKLKILFENRKDKNPVTYISDNGIQWTVLHRAASEGHVNIIRWYREDLHFDDINPLDSSGFYTPMAFASQQGKLNVVKYYIEALQGEYKVLDTISDQINIFGKKMGCTVHIHFHSAL